MPPESASIVDADRQEPCGTLPPSSGVGAISGAARIALGVAVSQKCLTSRFPAVLGSVPGLFPVQTGGV
jgi:hypothetical protein